MRRLLANRDFYAGALIVFVGLGTFLEAQAESIGTLDNIGPGLFPVILGVLLIVVGLLISLGGVLSEAGTQPAHPDAVMALPDWRGCAGILSGVLAFLVLGLRFGLIPATFACVFLSSRGDRLSTWKESFILALVMTICTVGLFWYALQIPFPLLEW